MRLLALLASGVLAVPLVAAPVPKALKKPRPDAERFVGRWEVVVAEEDGTPVPGKGTWTFDEKQMLTTVSEGDPESQAVWPVRLDPRKSPKEIDIGGSGGIKGIYEFDNEDIKVAFSPVARPASFDPKPRVCYHLLRRVEPKKDK